MLKLLNNRIHEENEHFDMDFFQDFGDILHRSSSVLPYNVYKQTNRCISFDYGLASHEGTYERPGRESIVMVFGVLVLACFAFDGFLKSNMLI